MHFNKAIHSLRGLASLSVVLFHIRFVFGEHSFLFWFLGYFSVGVEVFFMISGYVLLQSLYQVDYNISKYPKFILKRFIRIEPLYLLVLSLAAIQSVYHSRVFGDGTYNMEWQRYFSHFAYLTKFLKQEWWLAVFWTLGLEFQFYLIIGILCLMLFSKNKWLNAFTVVFLSIIKFVIVNEDLVFFYLWFFVLGIILFQMKNELLPKYFGYLAIAIILVSIGFKHDSVFVPVICGAALVLIYFENLYHKTLHFFGDISYPLYLCHGLVLAEAARYMEYFTLNNFIKMGLIPWIYIAFSIALAWILHRIVEQKCLTVSKKIKY